MAKFLIIKSGHGRAGICAVGDLVGIYPDTWVFSDGDLSECEVKQIVGVTVDQANRFIESKLPSLSTGKDIKFLNKYMVNVDRTKPNMQTSISIKSFNIIDKDIL
jgi:hypothetical protein